MLSRHRLLLERLSQFMITVQFKGWAIFSPFLGCCKNISYHLLQGNQYDTPIKGRFVILPLIKDTCLPFTVIGESDNWIYLAPPTGCCDWPESSEVVKSQVDLLTVREDCHHTNSFVTKENQSRSYSYTNNLKRL